MTRFKVAGSQPLCAKRSLGTTELVGSTLTIHV